LRADNADQRLTDKGIAIGCVGSLRARHHAEKMAALAQAHAYAASVSLTPTQANRHGLALNLDGQRRNGFELLSHPNIGVKQLAAIWPELGGLPPKIAEQLEIDAKYAVYLDRQAADIAAFRRDEGLELPEEIDYAELGGLSNEIKQKLAAVRPRTVGQAGRIDGMTPVALSLLLAHIRRHRRSPKASVVGN
jgi:tRNA uridine 5-carboxymethylaminomethyl modification enzyme